AQIVIPEPTTIDLRLAPRGVPTLKVRNKSSARLLISFCVTLETARSARKRFGNHVNDRPRFFSITTELNIARISPITALTRRALGAKYFGTKSSNNSDVELSFSLSLSTQQLDRLHPVLELALLECDLAEA